MMTYLLFGLTLGLSASAQPGPYQAYLLTHTVRHGWQRTLPATLAPLLSDGPIILLILVILTRLPAWLLALIQIGGGLFILSLAHAAWQTWRQAAGPVPGATEPTGNPAMPDSSAKTAWRGLWQATVMNLLNPNPYLFWGAVGGPTLLAAWRVTPGHGLAFLAGFYSLLIGGFVVFVFLYAFVDRLGPTVSRALNAISALALLFFGLYQLWQGGRLLVT